MHFKTILLFLVPTLMTDCVWWMNACIWLDSCLTFFLRSSGADLNFTSRSEETKFNFINHVCHCTPMSKKILVFFTGLNGRLQLNALYTLFISGTFTMTHWSRLMKHKTKPECALTRIERQKKADSTTRFRNLYFYCIGHVLYCSDKRNTVTRCGLFCQHRFLVPNLTILLSNETIM